MRKTNLPSFPGNERFQICNIYDRKSSTEYMLFNHRLKKKEKSINMTLWVGEMPTGLRVQSKRDIYVPFLAAPFLAARSISLCSELQCCWSVSMQVAEFSMVCDCKRVHLSCCSIYNYYISQLFSILAIISYLGKIN